MKISKKKVFEIVKDSKLLKCTYPNCKKKFRVKGNLTIHTRFHTKERPFICNYQNCGKTFICLGNLKTHESKHTGVRTHKCEIENCNKSYTRYFRLKIHMRTHNGYKPYVCPFINCGKSFNEKGNLKTHVRIHTGEKPFKCDFHNCPRMFITQGHLKEHLNRHNNILNYECDECNHKFIRKSSLNSHMKTHLRKKRNNKFSCRSNKNIPIIDGAMGENFNCHSQSTESNEMEKRTCDDSDKIENFTKSNNSEEKINNLVRSNKLNLNTLKKEKSLFFQISDFKPQNNSTIDSGKKQNEIQYSYLPPIEKSDEKEGFKCFIPQEEFVNIQISDEIANLNITNINNVASNPQFHFEILLNNQTINFNNSLKSLVNLSEIINNNKNNDNTPNSQNRISMSNSPLSGTINNPILQWSQHNDNTPMTKSTLEFYKIQVNSSISKETNPINANPSFSDMWATNFNH